MDIRRYWIDVEAKVAEIAPKYPQGVVHLISRHNREKNTTSGALVTAGLELAGECLVNNTHDLATDQQIEKYKVDQAEKRRLILLNERAKKQEFVMVVDRSEAEARSMPMPSTMQAHAEQSEKRTPASNAK